MRSTTLVSLAAGLVPAVMAGSSSTNVPDIDLETGDHYVLNLRSKVDPNEVAVKLGLRYNGQLGALDNLHVFAGDKTERDIAAEAIEFSRRRKRSLGETDVLDSVRFTQKQQHKPKLQKRIIPPRPEGYVARRAPDFGLRDDNIITQQNSLIEKLEIKDPIFRDQWHLFNVKQGGHDVNVTGLWLEGITGNGTIVAMVDDGLDMYSDDLKNNYYADGSYDFNDRNPEPKPRLPDDHHGTRCAGEIAAGRNDACGLGVAYDSRISGLRILGNLITDADEAVAMTYDFEHNQIYSCSWGPADDGRTMEAPGILIRQAMLKGIQDGRNGLGSVYVFASGNGAASDDNCNFDGYTNSIYSITVGAVDHNGDHPYYSEKCSANMVVTYSSGGGDAIHTTDVGTNNCYGGHGGTSAAAPLAAGIFALVLQVRPDLTWRDMQWLVMNTAVQIHTDVENEWQTTSIGRKFSHTYGYGKLDSYAIVKAAEKWEKVKPQSWFYSPWQHVNKDIPQGNEGLVSEFEVTEQMLKDANLETLEHVTVTMNVKHGRRGDLGADLISPSGVVSHISTARRLDASTLGYNDWTFMSVAHWGETGIGKWKVVLKDTNVNDKTGQWIDWHLKLWGESIEADKAVKLPMPTEDDDKDHEKIMTQSAAVSTATIAAPPTSTEVVPTTVPSDHPDRPTKPTGGSSIPVATSAAPASSSTEGSSWVNWLPSFGSSARVWIIGASALIASFCVGLGIYLFLARRKRIANDSRSGYEFEPLQAAENGVEKGAGGAAGRTRGGELYDAFAGGSDDEDEDFAGYRDAPRPEQKERELHTIGDNEDGDEEEEGGSGSGGSSDRDGLLRSA